MPAGQQVLLARQALAHGTGAETSPCLAALLEQIAPIGFAPLPGCEFEHGGRRHRATMLDLGPESVAGWVCRLAADDPVAAETRLDGDPRARGRRAPDRAHAARVRRAPPPARARGAGP